jgi:hypothetical protein
MHMPWYILNYLGATLWRSICLPVGSAPSFEHQQSQSVLCQCLSENLVQEHVKKYKTGAAELKDLMQQVLHHCHPDFNPDNVDHDMHEQLMALDCIAAGNIEECLPWNAYLKFSTDEPHCARGVLVRQGTYNI